MKEVNFERTLNAVERLPMSLVFVNQNGTVSVTKDLKMFDSICRRVSPLQLPYKRIIGVYTSDVDPRWVEEDLEFCGFMDG